MDYELVIDLTDANTQAYVTNLSQIFSNLLGPSFDIHERNKYFTSISIKCNLNIPQLPDAKILPSLQDLNNKTNTAIGNSLIKLKGPIQRPSLQTCLKRHRLKNKYHHKRLLNNNHNTSSSSSSPNSSPLILPSSSSSISRRNKKRTFVSNNRLIAEDTEKKKKPFLPPPKIPHVPSPPQQPPPQQSSPQSPPPPSYTDVIAQELNHNNNNNNNHHHHFGLSDKQWQLQFDLLNHDDEEEEGKKEEIAEEDEEEEELKQDAAIRVSQEDEDLALALRLQEEQQNIDDDMKIALQLQKEEEMRAKQQRARVHRYRNPNFVDFGSHPSDIPDIFGRMMSEDTDNLHNLQNIHNIHNIHDHDADDILSLYLNEFQRHHQGSSSSSASSSFAADDSWQRLPVHTLKAKDVEILRKSQEKKSCPICMTDFVVNDVTRQLPCFHTFHKDCIDKWFHQQNDKGKDASCPLDRKKIKDIANQHV